MGACGVPTTTAAPTAPPSPSPWPSILALVGAPILLYVPLVGYRWDYLSHYLIGAGAVLGVVGVGRLAGWSTDRLGAVAAVLVLVLSAYTEHRWFGALVFDWADIGAGGLGACGAAVALVGRDRPGGGPLVAIAVAVTLAGLALRVGTGGLPG
jgi:hypothetical protein